MSETPNLEPEPTVPAGHTERLEGWSAPAPAVTANGRPSHGRYAVLEPHAQGGLGKVSLASDTKLQRTVALKEIRPDRLMDDTVRQRFINEAAITGQLEHPGIVPIYSLDEDDAGRPYYAMRFIQGRTLTRAIADYHAQPTPLGLRGLLQRFVGVCQTMGYAHSRGVIHRDLKPDNIILGDYGETLVIDWGLAKRLGAASCESATTSDAKKDLPSTTESTPASEAATIRAAASASRPTAGSPLTEEGQIMGTPAYMAPEQARGELPSLGPATDVYALGAILYSLLTGRQPYRGDLMEVVALLQQETPPLPEFPPTVPAPLAAICRRALAARPAERFSSAVALAQDVERWLADEPVSAFHEPIWTRARRWLRRHRTLVTGAAAALGMLVLALGVLAVVLNLAREREAGLRTGAESARDRARQTMEQMTSDEALAFLRRQPVLLPEQRAFLQKATEYYQELAAEAARTPAERARQARAYYRLGLLHGDIGRAADARAAFASARPLYERLAQESPAEADYQLHLGHCFLHHGDAQDELGQHAAAEADFRSALAAYQQLPDGRRQQGTTWNYLGNLWKKLGRLEDTARAYTTALGLYEQLLREQPASADFRRGLADSQYNLGTTLRAQNHDRAALPHYEAALATYRKLATEDPADPSLQRNLANISLGMGALKSWAGDHLAAEEHYRQALDAFEKLAAQFPTVTQYRWELANAHGFISGWHSEVGQLTRAEPHRRRALELMKKLADEHPGAPSYRAAVADRTERLARLLERLRRFAEAEPLLRDALKEHQALAQEFPAVPAYRQNTATTRQRLGLLLSGSGRVTEWEAPFLEALRELRVLAADYPTVPDYRRLVALALDELALEYYNCGRYADTLRLLNEAEAITRDLMKQDDGPEAWRRLGSILSNKARALARLGRLPESIDTGIRASKAHAKHAGVDPEGMKAFMKDSWQRYQQSWAPPPSPGASPPPARPK